MFGVSVAGVDVLEGAAADKLPQHAHHAGLEISVQCNGPRLCRVVGGVGVALDLTINFQSIVAQLRTVSISDDCGHGGGHAHDASTIRRDCHTTWTDTTTQAGITTWAGTHRVHADFR